MLIYCLTTLSTSTVMSLWWWWSLLFLINIHGYRSQQSYINDNLQLDCSNKDSKLFGYTCNPKTSIPTCLSYITFRSLPPFYNTPSTIAALLNTNPNDITAINNYPNDINATIAANTIVIVPIHNCSCSEGGYYQYNASYVLKATYENYYTVANETYEGLTTCQAMRAQNKYGHSELDTGYNLTVPIRCACPSANQTAVGVKYMLTWLVTWGDDIDYMSHMFGVDVQSILDANELTVDQLIFPFTPVLIPLTAELKGINISPAPPPPPAPPTISLAPDGPVLGHKSSHKRVFVGIGIGVGLLLIVSLFGVLIWCLRRRKIQHSILPVNQSPSTVMTPESNSWSNSSEWIQSAIESLTIYKYEKLQMATNDFAEENKVKVSVYQGIFDGDYAAVKIMNGDVLGEINILKRLNHSNIIRLSGFCMHQGNTYLIYEFAENGCLRDWLHESVLDWKQRVQIVYDVAVALNCLHNFMTPPCIHKNLKSSNVLLDGNMRAKITNFGMAKSLNENSDDELQLTRHVVGTVGYMPPEYIENGLITPKMDVFAFGVLIAELLSGKEAATRSPDVQLSELIKEVVGDDIRDKMVGFMDEKLRGDYQVELAYSMAMLASRCVATDLNNRPCMTDVLMTLLKMSLTVVT